jgi:D-3-phosphoglycerate dehydrogenase / 2-oxoglutarate reductase
MDIPQHGSLAQRRVSNSLSVSPSQAIHSSPSSYRNFAAALKQLKPFDTKDIKVLLLENVNQTGRDILSEQGYQVEVLKTSLPEEELIEKIR